MARPFREAVARAIREAVAAGVVSSPCWAATITDHSDRKELPRHEEWYAGNGWP